MVATIVLAILSFNPFGKIDLPFAIPPFLFAVVGLRSLMRAMRVTRCGDASSATQLHQLPPCLACGHDRRGLAPESRCPECGSPPLAVRVPSESQRSFLVVARMVLLGLLLVPLAAMSDHSLSQHLRVAIALSGVLAAWNWPQLWLSEPQVWRARARTRLGLIAGIWLALVLTALWNNWGPSKSATSWSEAALTLCTAVTCIAIGQLWGRRLARRVLSASPDQRQGSSA